MKLNISAFIAALILAFTAVTPALADEAQDQIARKISEAVPGLNVTSVEESEAAGLYRVQSSAGETFYSTADGQYVLTGDMLKITSQGVVNVSEQARADARLAKMEAFGTEGVIRFPAAGEEKAVISVFTDIDCPYCRKLHEEVPQLNDFGITVNYYAFPRSGPGTASWAKYESVWCSDDPQSAMTAAKSGERLPQSTCDNPVEAQYRLGQEVGVTGTPAIVLEDGNMVRGYVPARNLAQGLGLL